MDKRHDDPEPVTVDIVTADLQSSSPDLLQHTWNRLVEDFIAAIRTQDRDHERPPSLPTLADGLHTEMVIAAARGSSSQRRWVAIGEQPIHD